MTFPFTTNSIVRDIVNKFPKSSDIFKKYRIDFCCGGNISLANAIAAGSIDTDAIMADLTDLYNKNANVDTNPEVWTDSDTNTIIDHVISQYHRPLEEELAQLSPYVTKISRVHGDNHPELVKVNELFYEFKKEMLEHCAKEEEIVFPLIRKLANNEVEDRSAASAQILELEKEHDAAGAILMEIREITSDFVLPVDACGTYTLVFKRLEELEGQTFMHVHLENNILFPRYINE
jgi:regulator of cell morphogenesis and NO signaling